jgi:hypothetical protein
MRWMLLCGLLCLPLSAGCSKEDSKARSTFGTVSAKVGGAPEADMMKHVAEQGAPGQPPKGVEPVEKKEKQRKIRYTADMKLIVEKIDSAEELLDAAKKEAKGEYAKVEINNSPGVVRSGTWRIRVPVENLHSFRKAVAKIGDVERNNLESEDMTAQYYDLKADIDNRMAAQEALRDLLKETGKKEMRHYLDVWDKLEQISGEINRKKGQLKLWEDLTDLTTFTVHMREKQPFVPETKAADKEVPTFGKRASTTWNDSWENFLGFCQIVVIVVIALVPWLPVPLVFLFFVYLIARRLARSSQEPPVVLEVVEEKK